jgi:hypothetical protein
MANTVDITNLADGATNDMPFNLQVAYVADLSGLEVAVQYSGYTVSPQDAPPPGDTLVFQLNWIGTVTDETVTVLLRVKTDPTNVLASDYRTNLTFLGGPP